MINIYYCKTLYVAHVVKANKVPPHSVSAIAVLHAYFVNMDKFVISKVPYRNIPSKNASVTGFR